MLLDLTGLTPVPGTVADANQVTNALNAIKAVVNNLDGANINVAATPTVSALTVTVNLKTAISLSGAGAGLTIGGDANLYRFAAGGLATDGNLRIGNGLVVDQNNGGAKVYFGSANDTNVYRSAANVLKTDGAMVAVGNSQVLGATGDAQPQIKLAADSGGAGLPGIEFGPGGGGASDVKLVRDSANRLAVSGGQLRMNFALQEFKKNLVYNTIITLDASTGNYFHVNIADGVAFQMANPTNLVDGQRFTIVFLNTSGVTSGAITWGTNWKGVGSVTGTIGNNIFYALDFVYNGTTGKIYCTGGANSGTA